MKLYTLGFTKKTAEEFFELIKENKINLLIDIRLINNSQLAGFSKGKDLAYFLKALCACCYVHDETFAPTKEIMDGMRSKKLKQHEFDTAFSALMDSRTAMAHFEKTYGQEETVCLLCSEETPDTCHRRVLATMVQERLPNIEIIHL